MLNPSNVENDGYKLFNFVVCLNLFVFLLCLEQKCSELNEQNKRYINDIEKQNKNKKKVEKLRKQSEKIIKKTELTEYINSTYPNMFKIRFLPDGRILLLLKKSYLFDKSFMKVFNNYTEVKNYIDSFYKEDIKYDVPF